MNSGSLHERIVGAEHASDLSEGRFAVQVLRAVGAAAVNARLGGYAARALSTMGRSGIPGAVEELVREAQRTWPGFELREYVVLARGAVAYWLKPACPACSGRKFQVLPGTPTLSDQVCPECEGTGLRKLDLEERHAAVVRWMCARLDLAINEATRAVSRKLGWGVLAH